MTDHEDEEVEEEVAVQPPVINLLQEDDSDEDEQSDPPKRKRKRLRQSEDRQVRVEFRPQPTECSICFDPCTMQGRHRVAVLKCGHLFGNKCIQRWIKERKSCPNCNVAVRSNDIRLVFSDHVAVVDNSAVQDLHTKYEEEKSRRIQLETELSRVSLQLAMAQTEKEQEVHKWKQRCLRLQHHVTEEAAPPMLSQSQSQWSQRSGGNPGNSPVIRTNCGLFKPEFRLRLTEARVFQISDSCELVCVGDQCTSSSGGNSHGLRKVSTLNATHSVQIPCHRSPIRDLRIDPPEKLVLTTSLDSQLLVSSLQSQTVVAKYSLSRPGWSCAFGVLDPFAIFCGLNDGRVVQYDLRFASSSVSGLSQPVRSFGFRVGQPVHSIRVIKTGSTRERLVAASFGGFAVWELNHSIEDAAAEGLSAPPEIAPCFMHELRNCSSMSNCQSRPGMLLFSSRLASMNALTAEHAVWDLESDPEISEPVKKWSFHGNRTSSALSRSMIWSDSSCDAAVVAAGDEETKQICLWDSTRHSTAVVDRLGKLGSESVVDIHHAIPGGRWSSASNGLLGALTPHEMIVFSHRQQPQATANSTADSLFIQ